VKDLAPPNHLRKTKQNKTKQKQLSTYTNRKCRNGKEWEGVGSGELGRADIIGKMPTRTFVADQHNAAVFICLLLKLFDPPR
jgi:hypothetical protein